MTVLISKPSINLREKLSELSNNGTAATRDHGTEANEVPLNSDLPTFGTAATEDVTTSNIDNTAGRLLRVGDFGLGAYSPNLNETSFNTMLPSKPNGWYVVSGTTDGPSGAAAHYGICFIQNRGGGDGVFVTYYARDWNQVAIRRYDSSAWQDWEEIWHTGNLVKTTSSTDTTAGRLLKTGDAGLLATQVVPSTVDLDTLLIAGKYYCQDTSPNLPWETVAGTLEVSSASITSAKTQFFVSTVSNKAAFRRRYSNVWSEWQEIYHTGNFTSGTGATNYAAGNHTHSDYLASTGGALTDRLVVQKNGVVGPTFSTGQLELQTTDGNDVSMGFRRSGFTACQLRHSSNGLILSGTTRTNAADFIAYGDITAYSDKRLKDNIEIIPKALDKVMQLNGYTFTRTNAENGNEDKRQTGVIAQEVLEVLPEAVSTDDDGYHAVAYGNMVGLLIEAIKELKQEIEVLKNGV